MLKPCLLRFILLLLPFSAICGQIIDIEDGRMVRDTNGWFGQLDLSGSFTRNTSDILSLGGNFRLDRPVNQNNWLLMAGYRLTQASGNNFLNAGFSHLRYSRTLTSFLQLEAFTQAQYNEIIRLDLRWLIGVGPKLKLINQEKARLFLGILYMYEHDDLRNADFSFNDHRLSNYLSLAWEIADNLRLTNTTYYQPRLVNFDAARLNTTTNVSIGIGSKFKFTSRFNFTLDERINEAFSEVPGSTFSWNNGLRFQW
ncbi:MAG: DUF481 domain-containing protein [Bacteroidota bacterium]